MSDLSIETCPDPITLQDRQRWELESLREWLDRHLQTNVVSRRTGLGGHDGNGTTWAAVAIPDWEVKQRIERISVALGRCDR